MVQFFGLKGEGKNQKVQNNPKACRQGILQDRMPLWGPSG